jgi:hypothetical protein
MLSRAQMKTLLLSALLSFGLLACGRPSVEVGVAEDALHCSNANQLHATSGAVSADYACPGPMGCSGGEQPTCDFRGVADLTPCPDFAEGMGFTDDNGQVVCQAGAWHRKPAEAVLPAPGS